jgi:hypothetical protein
MCSNSHTGDGRGGWASDSGGGKIKKAHPKAQSYPQVVHRVWISSNLSTSYPQLILVLSTGYPHSISGSNPGKCPYGRQGYYDNN